MVGWCYGEIELKASINNETIWLRQDEISLLFEKDRTVITRQRFKELENDVISLENKVDTISKAIKSDGDNTPKYVIFFDGQVFDTYVFNFGLTTLIR